jgi:hypothetical protein
MYYPLLQYQKIYKLNAYFCHRQILFLPPYFVNINYTFSM